eukprot:10057033-Karenia_brevis.AAC.1
MRGRLVIITNPDKSKQALSDHIAALEPWLPQMQRHSYSSMVEQTSLTVCFALTQPVKLQPHATVQALLA